MWGALTQMAELVTDSTGTDEPAERDELPRRLDPRTQRISGILVLFPALVSIVGQITFLCLLVRHAKPARAPPAWPGLPRALAC